MNKIIFALMALIVLLVTACAGTGQASGASDGGGLPEIAAVDDAPLEALPDVIVAE